MSFDFLRDRIFPLAETALFLNVSKSKIHSLIRQGRLRAIKLGGGTTRITGDSLADLLEAGLDAPRVPRGKAARSPHGS